MQNAAILNAKIQQNAVYLNLHSNSTAFIQQNAAIELLVTHIFSYQANDVGFH
jgi:hypothetical protein